MKVGKEFFITAYLWLYYTPCCKYPIKFNPQGGKWLHVL